MDALKTRVGQAEALAASEEPFFLVAGQEMLLQTYNQFTAALNNKVFIFPSEEFKQALDKEKETMAVEIANRSNDLVKSRADLFARQDLVILKQELPEVKLIGQRCAWKDQAPHVIYQKDKMNFFYNQSMCFASEGKWEAALVATNRWEESGGKNMDPKMKLAHALSLLAMGDDATALGQLTAWTKQANANSDEKQMQLVTDLLKAFGKISDPIKLDHPLSLSQSESTHLN